MNHVRLEDLLARQCSGFAVWQLRTGGWSRKRIACALDRLQLAGLRNPHDGVYVVGRGALTDPERWWAGTLTAPWTVLEGRSAAVEQFRARDDGLVHVVRPGDGRPYRAGLLAVRYAQTLRGEVVRAPAGFRITRPERTVIDVWPQMPEGERRKVLREGLRTRRVSIGSMERALARHMRRRGITSLRDQVAVYAELQLERCRSDAEAYAMEVLHGAGLALPDVNERVAGEEADLSWPQLHAIIEIDGPQWHRLRDEDARKTAIWTAAGQTVRRISSDDVFAAPDRLVALARGLGVPQVRRARMIRATSSTQSTTPA